MQPYDSREPVDGAGDVTTFFGQIWSREVKLFSFSRGNRTSTGYLNRKQKLGEVQ